MVRCPAAARHRRGARRRRAWARRRRARGPTWSRRVLARVHRRRPTILARQRNAAERADVIPSERRRRAVEESPSSGRGPSTAARDSSTRCARRRLARNGTDLTVMSADSRRSTIMSISSSVTMNGGAIITRSPRVPSACPTLGHTTSPASSAAVGDSLRDVRLTRERRSRLPVLDELHRGQQPATAHIADMMEARATAPVAGAAQAPSTHTAPPDDAREGTEWSRPPRRTALGGARTSAHD